MMVLNHNHLWSAVLFSSFSGVCWLLDISLMVCSTSMFSWDSEWLPSHHMIIVNVSIWLIIWWQLMWSSFDRYSITCWLDVSVVLKCWLINHMMSIDVWLTTWWPLMCPVDTIDNLMAGHWYMINKIGHWCIHLIWLMAISVSLPTWWPWFIHWIRSTTWWSFMYIHMMNQQYGGRWCFCFD